VGTTNVTVRFNEEELRKLDELAQRMGKTRSDVIRDLVNRFDEALRQQVEVECRKAFVIGLASALESTILDPTLVLRFVRRNADILGFPDFVIGMVRVRNRVVVFSHHDRIGHQLLQLVRARVEEEIRREETEIEQEGDEEGDVGGNRAMTAHVRTGKPARPNIVRAIPVAIKYKLVGSNKNMSSTAKPIVISTMSKPVNNDGRGGAKAAVTTSALGNQKLVAASPPNAANPASPQTRGSDPQASVAANPGGPAGHVDGGSMDGPAGDFIIALITQSYHKHRDRLLKLMESVAGG
jgi:predicted transcriptional regulator